MSEAVMPLRRPVNDREPPIRLAPKHGTPRCLMEGLSQYIWHHKLAVYIAVVATVSLLVEVGLGRSLHHLIYG